MSLSSVVMVAALLVYLKQVVQGQTIPNPATWLIALVVMILNVLTYYFVSRQSFWAVLVPIIIAVDIIVVLIYGLRTGRLGHLGRVEVASLVLALVVIVLWRTTRNDVAANLLVQVANCLAFLPTIVGLWRGQLKDRAKPWIIGTSSYVIMTIAVLLTDWHWYQLAFPVVTGILGNGSVALVIIWKSWQFRPARKLIVTPI